MRNPYDYYITPEEYEIAKKRVFVQVRYDLEYMTFVGVRNEQFIHHL